MQVTEMVRVPLFSHQPMSQNRKESPMTQASFWPEDPTRAHHGGNPESALAFEAIAPVLPRLQGMVLAWLCLRDDGGTVKEVRAHLHLEHQTASARLTELSKGGLIRRTGQRREGCGVWTITTEGSKRAAEWGANSTANKLA